MAWFQSHEISITTDMNNEMKKHIQNNHVYGLILINWDKAQNRDI